MKNFIMNLYASAKKFTIIDFAFFKIVLLAVGILLGVYLHAILRPFISVFWIIAIISYLYLMTKVIAYMRKK